MLAEEPSPPPNQPTPARRRSGATLVLLAIVALLVLILRHDYWFWDTPDPLLFGVLPVGLWWQGLVSLLAAGMMWLMVRLAWPQELENEALSTDHERGNP